MKLLELRGIHGSSTLLTTAQSSNLTTAESSTLTAAQSRLRQDSVSKLLVELDWLLAGQGYKSNSDTQLLIEEFCLNQFELLGSKNSYIYKDIGLNSDLLTPGVSKYLLDRIDIVKFYVDTYVEVETARLLSLDAKGLSDITMLDIEDVDFTNDLSRKMLRVKKNRHNRAQTELILKMINVLGVNEIIGAGIYMFYTCLQHWDCDDEESPYPTKANLRFIPLTSKIGRELINKYLYKLYNKDKGVNDVKDFKEWKIIYLATDNNSYINTPTIASVLGCKILEFFEASELLKKVIKRESRTSQTLALDCGK